MLLQRKESDVILIIRNITSFLIMNCKSDYKPLHNFPLFLSTSADTHPHTKSPTPFLLSMSEQTCFLSQLFSGIIFSERLLMQVSAFLHMAFLPQFSISAYICIHTHMCVCVCVCDYLTTVCLLQNGLEFLLSQHCINFNSTFENLKLTHKV